MKIALLTNVSKSYFSEYHNSDDLSDVLDKVVNDTDLDWTLTNQTINRLYVHNNPGISINHAANDDEIQIIIVAEIDAQELGRSVQAPNASEFEIMATHIIEENSESFRFSVGTENRLIELIDANRENGSDGINSESVRTTVPDAAESPSVDHPVAPGPVDSNSEASSSEEPTPEQNVEAVRDQYHPSETRTITVRELIARLSRLDQDAPIYLQFYRDGDLVDYCMPNVCMSTNCRTNIDNSSEIFEAGHAVIY